MASRPANCPVDHPDAHLSAAQRLPQITWIFHRTIPLLIGDFISWDIHGITFISSLLLSNLLFTTINTIIIFSSLSYHCQCPGLGQVSLAAIRNSAWRYPTLRHSPASHQGLWENMVQKKRKKVATLGEYDGKLGNLMHIRLEVILWLALLKIKKKTGYPPFFAEIQWHQGAVKTFGHTSPSLKLHQELQWPAGTKRSKDVHNI